MQTLQQKMSKEEKEEGGDVDIKYMMRWCLKALQDETKIYIF
jgi:hypothetical protein